ncbi:DNRLRE domain-containing protein, partial [Pontiella sp.]|uniref:CBM96 family carbohydrate-binding protein n=1 Tax=Pontiella sp. TaxID=2837462 RepID=UPI0035620C5A
GTAGYALQITATSGGSFLPGFEWTRTTGGNAYTGGAGYEDGAHREDRDFALALTAPESEPEPGTLTVSDSKDLSNPDILAYNLGHFMAGTATHDWWRYSGVNGARIFISPATLESDSYVLSESNGDGVTDLAGFLARKEALRADPLNEDYINWTYFNDRFENKVFAGNRFTVNYALGKLRELDIDVLVQATAKENHFPITDADDWGGKWELWQHFYIQAFYLGRYFDVHRFQMFNEPNHSNADGLTPENWLMRLQLASDAIQSATADVNTMYGKSLEPLVYGPVNSSGADYYSGTGWGDYMVENRHVNFLGETNENYLVVHRYDYHEYNSGPGTFASNLSSLRSALNADMSPETRFPISLSEFNVHTAGDFDEMVDTLDYPAKYTRFGAIAASLADDFLKEFYCFKFGQVTKDGTYPVGKNGMHYVQNDGAYEYGGATKAAEVWRLFIKALKPGGEQKKFDLDGDSSPDDLYIRATYVPDAGNYYIFIANEGGGTNLRVDTSAWGLPEGTPFLLEEVSESRYGIGRTWNQVSADGTLWDGEDNEFYMAGDQVWLFTIAAKDTEDELIIDATEDASVVDGINAGTQYGSESTLLVRNDPTTANERKATFIKFDLPVYYPPDIQRAVLTFTGKSESNVLTQAHVYGLDDDSWSEDSLTWNNAPNLLKGAAAGNLIENRVVSGQGDSAFIQGQLVFPNDSNKEQIIDVTDFLRSQSNREVSFMITQDPRWDVALPSLAVGDTQPGGLEIKSIESGSAPRLKIVLLQDTDGDGISNEAESNDFNTDPEVADTDGDGQGDGEEIFAGSDPNDSSSVFAIPTALPFDGGFKVEWNSRTDRTYLLDRAFSLSSSNWAEIYSADGTGSTMTYLDSIGNTNAFYRLNVQ